jgi:hypothetical protein
LLIRNILLVAITLSVNSLDILVLYDHFIH